MTPRQHRKLLMACQSKFFGLKDLSELYIVETSKDELKEITYVDKATEIYYNTKRYGVELAKTTKPTAPVVSFDHYAGGNLGKVEKW